MNGAKKSGQFNKNNTVKIVLYQCHPLLVVHNVEATFDIYTPSVGQNARVGHMHLGGMVRHRGTI